MSHLRVGLIGCGFISRSHLTGWQGVEDAQVVAVCDVNHGRAEARAAEYGIGVIYPDYRAMLAAERLDIVDLATPAHTHRGIVEAAAAGCHILCQKPFAETLVDACAMADAAECHRVTLMVHQNFRWRFPYPTIRHAIVTGLIGTPFYGRITQRIGYMLPRPDDGRVPGLENQPQYRNQQRLITFEMALHHVDLTRYLFGEPESVYAQIRNIAPYTAGDDCVHITLRYGRVIALVDDSWCSPGLPVGEGCRVEGDHGVLSWDGAQLLLAQDGRPPQPLPPVAGDGVRDEGAVFSAVQRSFVSCLRTGAIPPTSGRDNLRTLAAVLACYDSAEQKTIIPLLQD
ncbi:MAG: Gfo/Idh/MocA family oxidoreductase [Candidatus Latescibacteria bacterium]|nr:Gfo/Idh/MocA family oxidoreductase [Candidatus Latescibacterota bacterium]